MPAQLHDTPRNEPPSRPGWSARFAAMSRSRAIYVPVSLLLLAPCHWQARLTEGDLSSHNYSSWLARLIESGRAEGLEAVHQTTNLLFDLILGGLIKIVGAGAAQRIAISLAVLTFVWGAFAFVSEWSLQRVFMTSGTNTSWTFDAKYSVMLVGLLLVWGTMFLELLHHWGMRRVVSSSSFQLCVVGSAGVFALPVALAIPGSHHALAYISEPMALGVAVCICALLGAARPRMLERYALEDRMQGVVAQSAPGHGVAIRGVKAGISCGSTNWRAFEDRRPHT
jgi:hypothetical protein